MKIEKRVFNVEFRAQGDDEQKIRGYGAVFDAMSENLGGFREIIAPGAFDGRIQDDVRGLINHDQNLILGRTTSGTMRLFVDENGLGYEIDMPDTTYARDLMVSMERGDVSQSSFAFTVEDDDWREDDEGRVIRTITKVGRLYDVSPVTYPAYPDTSAATRSLEDFKESQAQAKELTESKRDLLKRKIKILSCG